MHTALLQLFPDLAASLSEGKVEKKMLLSGKLGKIEMVTSRREAKGKKDQYIPKAPGPVCIP